MNDSVAVLTRRLERSEERVRLLEAVLEDRTREVFLANEQLRSTSESLAELFKAVPGAILVIGDDSRIEAVNGETLRLLGYDERELVGENCERVFGAAAAAELDLLRGEGRGERVFRAEREVRGKDKLRLPVLLSATTLESGGRSSVVCVAADLTERKKLEADLLHAHKLESIGRLAAGVAHELNTPIQFISDSVRFARQSLGELASIIGKYQQLRRETPPTSSAPELLTKLEALALAEQAADLPFLLEQLPGALDRALEGLQQVASIVRSTKDFAYPTTRERRMANLNKALMTTLTIARHEYAEVADVELELGELPLVPCHVGELNQVFLNLLVNAAHAIQDRPRSGKGRICLSTRVENGQAVVAIGDDGAGIPEAVRGQIFDPFFTTKDVGRGSGQGLAIARSVVVERHQGQLHFETELGRGTTFFVRLPLNAPRFSSTPTMAAVRLENAAETAVTALARSRR